LPSLTDGESCITSETSDLETPARAATSWMVGWGMLALRDWVGRPCLTAFGPGRI
jgi:hypothetical protein